MNNNNINNNKNGSNNATIESLSPRLHAIQMDPMEFLCRSWTSTGSASIDFLKPTISIVSPIPEDAIGELDQHGNEDEVEGDVLVTGNPFTFGNSSTAQLVMERIMSQSQDVSSLTSGRLSHSSGPLNGGQSGGSPSDSPPVSPYDFDNYCRVSNSRTSPHYRASSKTVGRWLRKGGEKKKEETRAHNAQLHAAISVAGVAAAVAAIAAATAAESGSRKAKTDVAVASAATLVAAQCVEAAEALGAERDHLAAAVGSAVNVHSSGDIITLTAAAATALRGAATLKARALKEVWNIAAVIPVGKGGIGDHHREHHHRHNHQQKHIVEKKENESSGELCLEENFLGQCSQEVLARGSELLKRTRKGSLHWKIVSVYVHRTGNVMLKMKSRHVAGTITKKKKFFVCEICKDVMAWPGRHLLEGGEDRRYFGLKTMDQRVIEFECRSQKEYEMWTHGVSRLLSIVTEKKESHKKSKNV